MVYKIPPFWLRQSWLLPPRTHDTLFKKIRERYLQHRLARLFVSDMRSQAVCSANCLPRIIWWPNWQQLWIMFSLYQLKIKSEFISIPLRPKIDRLWLSWVFLATFFYSAIALKNRRVARIETKCLGFIKLVWIHLRGLWLFFTA